MNWVWVVVVLWMVVFPLVGSWFLLEPWTRKFLRRTVEHKWWVFVAGLATGAPLWRLLVHDLSKFLPSEAPHYGRQYYGPKDRREQFQRAWHLHQRRNPHHWEYWVSADNYLPLEMPEWAVREMVADWMAATRVTQGRWPAAEDWPWLEKNWLRIQLHVNTRRLVSRLLHELFPLTLEQNRAGVSFFESWR